MDIVTQRLIAIGNRIIAELRLLRDCIQQLVGAVHDSEKAQDKQQEQEPPVLRAELQIPEAIEREKTRHNNRQYRVQVWIASVTTLAFIAAAVYAGIAALQWRTMNKTYDEIRKQTAAAIRAANAAEKTAASATQTLGELKSQTSALQSQVDLTKRQLESTHAAIIETSNPRMEDTPRRVIVQIWNTRPATAHAVWLHVSITLKSIADGRDVKSFGPYPPKEIGEVVPVAQLAKKGAPITKEFPVPLSQEDLAAIEDTREIIEVDEVISYRNGFEPIQQSFHYCYLSGLYHENLPAGPGPKLIRNSYFVRCDDLADAVVRALAYKTDQPQEKK